MERLLVKNLAGSYGKVQVLKGVDLSADAGQCVGIVGRNGCGKSTLFRMLAGLKKADGGEILFDAKKPPSEYVGYVPQESCLLEELSVLDNLRLWYRDKSELRSSLEQGVLRELGVSPICRKRVEKLSGGMKKRVSIGCALAGNPPILILDEPGAALDLLGKAGLWRYLAKYRELGGTVLIATHDEGDLGRCDKLYALRDGRCKEIDRSLRGEELINNL